MAVLIRERQRRTDRQADRETDWQTEHELDRVALDQVRWSRAGKTKVPLFAARPVPIKCTASGTCIPGVGKGTQKS